MKKILLLSVLFTACFALNAQRKVYAWPPKIAYFIRTDVLDGTSINLEIKDFRMIALGSKVKVSFKQIADDIKGSITKTYGKEFINHDSETKVLIKVYNYDATIYTAQWVARIKYLVKINDNEEEVIQQSNTIFNTLGIPGAKKLLNKCFTGTNMKLFDFLNNNLRED
jgi:hypothetical protein